MFTSGLARPKTGSRDAGDVIQTIQLGPQPAAPGGRQFVGLLVSRGVILLEAIDPAAFEQPAKGSVERPCAQPDAALAESFDILDEGVPMARLVGQTD